MPQDSLFQFPRINLRADEERSSKKTKRSIATGVNDSMCNQIFLTMLTSEIASKLAIVKSIPTYSGSPTKEILLQGTD